MSATEVVAAPAEVELPMVEESETKKEDATPESKHADDDKELVKEPEDKDKKKEKKSRRDSRSRSRSRSRSSSRSRSRSASRSRSRSRGKFGKVVDIWLASYHPFYAFITYKRDEDAEEAIRKMNDSYIRRQRIRVAHALPRRERFGFRTFGGAYNGGGGGYGGGGGGYGGSYNRRWPQKKHYEESDPYIEEITFAQSLALEIA
ncbi:hypothetical protein TELCIR_00599 [Teladorsagia circumcincta]|uniref:RRM domain-containing protein n=1 Tax=Teladorsagia circumcincta TaxID=45464 RepID=A0A2G9V5P9_TELCI|nr:hypothetical protein TELCIR_00599 [Teladorsagia circumcincta]